MSRVAVLAGATGLVGGCLLDELLADAAWTAVLTVGRRPAPRAEDRLEQRVVAFDDPAAFSGLPAGAVVFSCLGTTIKAAGSQSAFRAVDHDAVLGLASAAAEAGCSQFLHVTALGADPRSRIFYNRVKGETERDVAALDLPTVVAFRPSILDGARAESRPAELLGLSVMRLAAPVLGRYAPTRALTLARAMLAVAADPVPGARVIGAGEISALAGS